MKQTLLIFRKDLRHLWPRIVILLLLFGLHAVFDVRSSPVTIPETMRANSTANILSLLLPLAMFFLIASVIFEEILPGDRQFWLTRPYRWTSLLGAKILFLLAFINVPLLISDLYILFAQHLMHGAGLTQLLLRQFLFAALFVLPSLALATVTTGFAQFVLAWFIVALALLLESLLMHSLSGADAIDMTLGYPIFLFLLVAVCCGSAVWQYAKRGTMVTRAVLLGATCAYMPLMFGIERLPYFRREPPKHVAKPDRFAVQVSYDLDRNGLPQNALSHATPGFVQARVPLRVEALPAGTLLRGSAELTIQPGGRTWQRTAETYIGYLEKIGDQYWLSLDLPVAQLSMVRAQGASLRGFFRLEVVTDAPAQTTPALASQFLVPGVGLCRVFTTPPQIQLTCRAGLDPGIETAVRLDSARGPGQSIASYMPPSVPSALSPTSDLGTASLTNQGAGTWFAFIPRHRLMEFEREVDIEGLQFTNYIATGAPY